MCPFIGFIGPQPLQLPQELIGKNISTEVGLVNGMRTVSMDGVSCGCGGTHVEASGEIKEVTIKKIQAKQGNIRVSYAVL